MLCLAAVRVIQSLSIMPTAIDVSRFCCQFKKVVQGREELNIGWFMSNVSLFVQVYNKMDDDNNLRRSRALLQISRA